MFLYKPKGSATNLFSDAASEPPSKAFNSNLYSSQSLSYKDLNAVPNARVSEDSNGTDDDDDDDDKLPSVRVTELQNGGQISDSEAILLREIKRLHTHIDRVQSKLIERIDYLEEEGMCRRGSN